jgi:hypothetical protein
MTQEEIENIDNSKQIFTVKDMVDAIQYGNEMQFSSTNEYYENAFGFISSVAYDHEQELITT